MEDFNPSSQRGNALDKLVTEHQLTPEGRDFLICSTNTFPDFGVQLAGWPDADSNRTIVTTFRTQTTVTFPAASSGAWDCLVWNAPLSNHHVMSATNSYASTDEIHYETHPTYASGVAPLNIYAADTGEALIPNAWPYTITNAEQGALYTVPASLDDASHRIIGWGYEITNVTPELYKGGTITCGTVSQAFARSQRTFVDDDVADSDWQSSTYEFNLPPATLEAAQNYPDLKTWGAAKGVYVNLGVNGVDNRFEGISHNAIIGFTLGTRDDSPGLITVGSPFGAARSYVPVPYNTVFAYCAGLPHESVLQIVMHTYVEYVPTSGDALLSTATPSAPYDVRALEVYAHIMREVSRFVPVSENGFGTLFRKVLKTVAKVAPSVGTVAEHFAPGSAAFSKVVASAAAKAAAALKQRKGKK